MIIDINGDIVQAVFDTDGIVIHKNEFAIAVWYTDEQKSQYKEMLQCQLDLSSTDYKAVKYAEGCYTEEEYAPIKTERQALRDKWNELNDNFIAPSLTDEEIEETIAKFKEKNPEYISLTF